MTAVADRCARIVRAELATARFSTFGMNDDLQALGADSIDMVSMQFAAEEEFGVHISDDEAAGVVTFGDLVRLVGGKING